MDNPMTLEERQVELEVEAVALGRERYLERLKDAESDSTPARVQINRIMPLLAKSIDEWVVRTAEEQRATTRSAALGPLSCIDPEQASYLALRYALDGAAAYSTVNSVGIALGTAVQDHIALASMALGRDEKDDDAARHMKRLFKRVLEQTKKATTAAHRKGVWDTVLRRYRPGTLKWSEPTRLQVGMKLIELLEATADLIVVSRQTEGRNDTPIRIAFTETARDWFEDAHLKASLWEPMHMPMLVPPKPWTSPFRGGYLTSAIKAQLIVTRSRTFLDDPANHPSQAVYDAVNIVQETPWGINKPVLDVMRQVWGMDGKMRELFTEAAPAIPLRPVGIPKDLKVDDMTLDQREELKTWRRAASIAYGQKARADARMASTGQTIGIAARYAAEDAMYFPHFVDFRGRIYPYSSYLSPQGDDVSRGLLMFARAMPLGERGVVWLKVHLANLFGVDKVSYTERVAWVDANSERLLDAAMNPLDGMRFWMDADSPWQALAACFEYAGYMMVGSEYESHLPIAMDGSCSGLQHFSAMLKDSEGAAQVNLLPSEKPGDIYTAVARRAQAVVDASADPQATVWKNGKISRKIAKQPTMTYCYSATLFGMAGQIENAMRKMGKEFLADFDDPRSSAVYLAGIVRRAIEDTVKAAASAMSFLQQVAVVAAAEGLPIRWTTPSGFKVLQEYSEPQSRRVKLYYQGQELKLMIATDEGRKLNAKRQAAGVAPNFVHGCDAAHLVSTVNTGFGTSFIDDWACIHDSFGVHACNVDALHDSVRQSFIVQYTPAVLARFRAEVADAYPEVADKLPPLPAEGDLDIEAVAEADYFFA